MFLFVYLRRWGRKAFGGRSIIAVTLQCHTTKKLNLNLVRILDSTANLQDMLQEICGHSVHDMVDSVMFLVWHMLNSKVYRSWVCLKPFIPIVPAYLLKALPFTAHMPCSFLYYCPWNQKQLECKAETRTRKSFSLNSVTFAEPGRYRDKTQRRL